MLNWQVAIPTYKRPTGCRDRTLAMLRDGGVPAERITIFVASEEERQDYTSTLDPASHSGIVVAARGMNVVRNAITRHYPHGSLLVEIDDDIRGIFAMADSGRKTLARVSDLPALFDRAFALCAKHGARLWGLYPVCNALFMQPNVSTDLRPIIGTVWGRVVDHRMPPLACEVKSDIERTLRYYLADGRVVRINDLSPEQRARTEPGGLQEPGGRTLEKSQHAAMQLMAMFPGLVHPAKARKGGHAEVRLSDRRRAAG